MKKFLDLGIQPLANKYLTSKDLNSKKKEQFYHLEVGFDNKTKLVSILNKVASHIMFDNKYPYRSSMSKTMIESFKKLSKKIKRIYKPKLILEIGSNDGSLIKNFNKKNAICVEPCKNLAVLTKKRGLNIVLDEKGIFIIEDPSLYECLKGVAYDQFYNEHIYVFSLLSIKNIIKKHNLEVFNVEKLKTHGGSIRYFIKKISNTKIKIHDNVKKQLSEEIRYKMNNFETYIDFGNKVKKSKKKLIQIFSKIKKKNKKIIGYGSTAKSVTVLNYCKIKSETLDYFVDTTPEKTKKYMPGTHIYIDKYKKSLIDDVDYIFLGAWNFKEEIFKKEKNFLKRGGKFITHIPIPKII